MPAVVEPMKDALPIEVSTEDGAKRFGLTGAELHALVDGLGGDGDRFVVVERVPASPEVYVQTWREGTGSYGVEFRDGSADRHFHVEIGGVRIFARVARRLADSGPRGRRRAHSGWITCGVERFRGYTHPRHTVGLEEADTSGLKGEPARGGFGAGSPTGGVFQLVSRAMARSPSGIGNAPTLVVAPVNRLTV